MRIAEVDRDVGGDGEVDMVRHLGPLIPSDGAAELVRQGGYIDWFNHRRLHGEITEDNSYVTPAEFEAFYYRQSQPAIEAVTQ